MLLFTVELISAFQSTINNAGLELVVDVPASDELIPLTHSRIPSKVPSPFRTKNYNPISWTRKSRNLLNAIYGNSKATRSNWISRSSIRRKPSCWPPTYAQKETKNAIRATKGGHLGRRQFRTFDSSFGQFVIERTIKFTHQGSITLEMTYKYTSETDVKLSIHVTDRVRDAFQRDATTF